MLHAHQLKPTECSLAIASCELGGEEYIIVGTGVASQDNYESTSGRLIVLTCSNGNHIIIYIHTIFRTDDIITVL